jgi:hypothetical protein
MGADQGPTPCLEASLRQLSGRLFELVKDDLYERIWPRLSERWGGPLAIVLEDAIVVRHDAGDPDDCPYPGQHPALVNGSVRLNSGYWGGALPFPRQAWDDQQVPVGALSVWFAADTPLDQSEPVSRGVKYRLALRWGRAF